MAVVPLGPSRSYFLRTHSSQLSLGTSPQRAQGRVSTAMAPTWGQSPSPSGDVQRCLEAFGVVTPGEAMDERPRDAAAAAAKSLQSCPILCDSRDGSPPGSPVPGILQARTLEWVAISFSNA